jgi:hypothetical protein
MMGYEIPSNFIKKDKDLIEKLLKIEIKYIKELLNKIKIFRDNHIQIFRRYKHAGFPIQIKEDYISSNPKIEYISMINTGKNDPFNVTALPFSINFIKNYEIFIEIIQNVISRILWNKLQSIEKRLDGILPSNIYTEKLTLTEKNDLMNLIYRFNFDNPNFIIRDQLQFSAEINSKISPWYYTQ